LKKKNKRKSAQNKQRIKVKIRKNTQKGFKIKMREGDVLLTESNCR